MSHEIERQTVKTEDGIELCVVKYAPETPKAQMFFLHGLSVPKEGPANILQETANKLAEDGFEVISFDFRGHGESDGNDYDATIATGLLDFDVVFKTFRSELPLGALGFSYGAAIIANYFAGSKDQPVATVFFSPALDFFNGAFNNPDSVMGRGYLSAKADGSLDKNGWFTVPNGFHIGRKVVETSSAYPTVENLAKVDTKLLILQSERDQMLDLALMRKLGEPLADKYILLDAIHGLTEKKAEAIELTTDWFSSNL